ncbi:class I SAM-dependent methyltransferase [Marinibacterium profundimaris]|uniref:Methylase n=1 Tax=Marinibacterium profundimaris TaxID=1679460 RepID=A0A225NQ45_9RHOB|nr:class I SAM-dependent methyltransferase [Marinibacterium profundimaris]OWU74652.1 methylase [Marinibacterium profundimaris]
MSAFHRLYSGLDREGPGLPEDVHWALDRLSLKGPVRVCDAGCGSGADTRTLGIALPEARIEAVEQMPHLAGEAKARCGDLGNVSVRHGDMGALEGPFDLIWSAGALYFLGVTEGLTAWADALAPGGGVAFSEPVRLTGNDPEVERFWAEYPALTDLDGIAARVRQAGYEMLDHRLILGAPWAAYYQSLAARIVALSVEADAEMRRVLDTSWTEIANWRAAPDRIAYALVIARPS